MNGRTLLFVLALAATLAGHMLLAAHTAANIDTRTPAPGLPQIREPADEAKAVVLARLEREAAERVGAMPLEYWKRDEGAPLRHALALSGALDATRRRLIELYGAAAERDSAFAKVFRPLDPELSFLSSNEQIELERLLLTMELERRQTGQSPDYSDVRERLQALIGPESLFEYELRRSPLAAQLRDSGVEFSEAEFRDTFRTISSFDASGADVESFLRMRDELKKLLGDRRFAQLWAARDPMFATVERAGSRHGLTQSTVMSVYSIMIATQSEMMRTAQRLERDPEQTTAALRELHERETQRISELVGEAAADDILGAVARGQLAAERDDMDSFAPTTRSHPR